MRAGLRVDSIFSGGENELAGLGDRAGAIDLFLVPRDDLKSVLATESPQLVAALIEPPNWTWAHLLDSKEGSMALIVMLAGIQDPGNLGTIVRSAEAFGAAGVVCLPGTVNAWNQKAMRASAGSVFRMPVLHVDEAEAFEHMQMAGVRVLTTAVERGQAAHLADLAGPVALVIGNEGKGVPVELARKADGAVTIPCPGPVESLNAAVAASVLLYEATRQRASARDRTGTRKRGLKDNGPSPRGGGR